MVPFSRQDFLKQRMHLAFLDSSSVGAESHLPCLSRGYLFGFPVGFLLAVVAAGATSGLHICKGCARMDADCFVIS